MGALRWIVGWVLLASVWLVLGASLEPAELVASALAAMLGVLFARRLAQLSGDAWQLPRRAWRGLLFAPGQVARDTLTVCAELVRMLGSGRARGGWVEVALPSLPEGASRAAAEAWVCALVTLSPNTVAVEVDWEARLLRVHTLAPVEARVLQRQVERLL